MLSRAFFTLTCLFYITEQPKSMSYSSSPYVANSLLMILKCTFVHILTSLELGWVTQFLVS